MIKIFIAGGRAGPPDVVQEVLADLKNLLSFRRYSQLEVAFTVQHNFPNAILSLLEMPQINRAKPQCICHRILTKPSACVFLICLASRPPSDPAVLWSAPTVQSFD